MGTNLVTVMGNRVAVRMDNASVFSAVKLLAQEFGITRMNLVTVRSGSVAERPDHDSFSTMPQRLERCSASRGRT